MVFVNNRAIIQKLNPILFNNLVALEDGNTGDVFKEKSKSGKPTLKVKKDQVFLYVHSKYDPEREANNFIEQFQISDEITHVFFIGTGLGYHINQFLKVNKEISFSIYEPNIEILYNFLTEVNLQILKEARLKTIFTDIHQISDVEKFVKRIGQDSITVSLPITEKLNKKEIDSSMKIILDILKNKRSEVNTNVAFQKRWIINSLKNFPEVLSTPNILVDIDKKKFKGKPVILVAAGPSLSFEIEHLKYIKEHRLAYIFSVGSAINALIENEIIPDAACTYDPTDRNQLVFQKIKDENRQNVPMVFGSSVGYETLENYPGPKVHMITSQDTVAANLLDKSQDIDIVLDSPSIAIITFQLLTLLEVSQIILVGQNFCYLNNERYAKGISYSFINNELSEDEIEKVIQIAGVNGKKVSTSESFQSMKKNLEYYILKNPHVPVINTTQWGAKIEGTQFILLENVIRENLIEKNIVEIGWYEEKSSYNTSVTFKKLVYLKNDFDKIPLNFKKTLNSLMEIEQALDKNILSKLERLYGDFDKEFLLIKQNKFYEVVLEPMIRVQNQILSDKSKDIKYERNTRIKAKLILESFGNFIEVVRLNHEFVTPIFNDFIEDLKEKGVYNEE